MLRNYLAIAFRNLRNRSGYAFINIFGLAVGMAAFFLITLFIQDELSYDRFHSESDRVYRLALEGTVRNGPLDTAQSATNWAPLLEAEIPEIERAVRIKPPNQMWLVAQGDRKFFEKGFVFADSTVFDVFDFGLIQGSPDGVLAAPFNLVISESMAEKYFGDEDPVGQTLRLDAQYEFEVTGVMKGFPEQSHFQADFLASLSTLRTPIYGINFLENQFVIQIYTYLLLSPGTDPAVVTDKIDEFIERTVGPMLSTFGVTVDPLLQPLTSIHLESNLDAEIEANSNISVVWTLSAIALFILMIACINYMNLATARSAGRAREVGMRKVLGAERGQLVRQFLGESLVLACFSVVVSVLLLYLALPAFNMLTGKSLSILSAGMAPSIAVLVGIVLICGIVAGSYPALFLSSFLPAAVLTGSSARSAGSSRVRQVLVVFQFAVSIILIAATVVVYQQLQFTKNMHLGFDKENVLVVQMTDPQIRNQYPALRAQVAALPSVVSVTASLGAPGFLIQYQPVRPEGAPQEEQTFVQNFVTDFDFQETLGMELIAGRTHSLDHPADTTGTFVLNEELVRVLGYESPDHAIGRNLMVFGGGVTGPIIGVVRDFHSESLHQSIEPAVMMLPPNPRGQAAQTYQYFLVRTEAGRTTEVIDEVGRIWNQTYPDYIYEYSFLDEDVDRLYAADQQLGNLFGGFAFLTVVIACLGLFGLASFTAEQRTKEVGIRKVMGATVPNIVVLLSSEFAKYVLIAFVFGAPLAYIGMQRWLDTFAYSVDFGIGTLIMVGLVALVISLLTVLYQSIRAASANPVDSLRHE